MTRRVLRRAPSRIAPRRRAKTARPRAVVTGPLVLKLGGELLEQPDRLTALARVVVRVARKQPLVIVHGGGREIDAALAQLSIPKHQVDGLRITDSATLGVVVAVLAGSINTRFVAAINAVGGRAVGLTGADAGVGRVTAAARHRATNGEMVDLGLVGEPVADEATPLIDVLCAKGYLPVVACIGAARDGQLLNVNADTLAGSLAARARASRLVIAGATAGVLDPRGRTIPVLDGAGIDGLVGSGTASAGMVAKLRACRLAAEAGVADVAIADGRDVATLARVLTGRRTAGGPLTRILPTGTGN